jgi:hypothetical protein
MIRYENTKIIDASYNVDFEKDNILIVDSSNNPVIITLPTLSSLLNINNQVELFFIIDQNLEPITLVGTGDNINGLGTPFVMNALK